MGAGPSGKHLIPRSTAQISQAQRKTLHVYAYTLVFIHNILITL